ncbi:H-NS histone family protein (plasmid) [Yersinia pestis]|uniref:DNA-binding protein H-NS n=1 Tax=Yersinia pestis Java 9 TaxID=880632 RepID=E8PSE9_YERPE|nr:H-NS family nucleoid-associated regulatory protein [Yersinia pestis]EDQ2484935.1 H-NS histone family protein [Salmonella enterica subsp. enterica serovar Oranienburg]EIT9024831.1 H-NS histone family protein [Escherichia coli]ADW66949.1 DNA-binding protein H-NS [Yersinia pestis Java 9]AJJ37999.1 H-NS histone family protein [Yersinia pestis]MDL1822018.1 H-NS family nucleoid-associated regulatory protein [Yersinia pestis]
MSENETYNEIRRTLSNIRSIRVFARETDFELLLDMHEKLGAVIEERREDAEREARERAEREQKRLDLLKLVEAEGFTPEELIGSDAGNTVRKKRNKVSTRPAKYRYTNPETGVVETWTGIGRQKKGFQLLLEAGHSADEFLIEQSAEKQGSANTN